MQERRISDGVSVLMRDKKAPERTRLNIGSDIIGALDVRAPIGLESTHRMFTQGAPKSYFSFLLIG